MGDENKTTTPQYNPGTGCLHVAVNRDFVDFCINDYRAKAFYQWLNGTVFPEETFFASLNHNPHLGIRGSFLGNYSSLHSCSLYSCSLYSCSLYSCSL